MVIWKGVAVDSLRNDRLVDEADNQGIRGGRRGVGGRGGREELDVEMDLGLRIF